jgi:hypothetical protein
MSALGGETYLSPPMDGPTAIARPETRARQMGLSQGVQPPMTDEEYKHALERMRTPWMSSQMPDPHRCVADDAPRGVRGGGYFQCRTVIADPREMRYCMEHAKKINYPLTPEQLERFTKEEARIRLQGLSSRAVAALEKVMDDPDAPAGVRAKAATDVLDRTGFHAKAGLDVQVEAVVIDMAEIIRQRLDQKRAQLQQIQVIEQDPEPSA